MSIAFAGPEITKRARTKIVNAVVNIFLEDGDCMEFLIIIHI
jgi:hypothetical protein